MFLECRFTFRCDNRGVHRILFFVWGSSGSGSGDVLLHRLVVECLGLINITIADGSFLVVG